ncbi:hypothetical protein SBADM41S_12367 [Streptomyces badius]
MQPDSGLGRRLRHRLVRGALQRLGLRREGGVRERPDRPEFGKNHQVSNALGDHQGGGSYSAGLDGFVRVHCDLDEGGAHTTTVLALKPSTRAYDRHTKALPGCLLAA